MALLTHFELRRRFANFWQKRGHKEVPPISLLPKDDPTTLFTSSGMQQLVPFLLGKLHPAGKRLYNIQRSFRSQDIEEVGDNRHTTFFEMLGNWSLGDYFKKEQLVWFWEFLTNILGLEKERLFISVFAGNDFVLKDEESAEIWRKLGVSQERIFYYDVSKNWWSRAGTPDQMPLGEIGGPDSEVFYDLGISHTLKYGRYCHPNCDCGRFLEIGNSVFIQYKKNSRGQLEELLQKNVDFGGGLERLLIILQEKKNVFETDVFTPIIDIIEVLSGKKYGEKEKDDRSFRVLADHLKAATFLIADGVIPSNLAQGYVLRRLIRRAIRFARNLHLELGFSSKITQTVIETFVKVYPYLSEEKEKIVNCLNSEEKKFSQTLERGLKEFEKIAHRYLKAPDYSKKRITGKEAFFLYETYGFPPEMTLELAKEQNLTVNLHGFEKEKERHKKISQKGMEKKFRMVK